MNLRFLAAFGIGIVIAALLVTGVLIKQKGARVGVTGQILKVRTASLDDGASVAVVDFRFTNPGDLFVIVRSATVVLEEAGGQQTVGQTISDSDAKRLMEGLPLLGQKYNESILIRDRIPSHATLDRMLAARFELPEEKLKQRKRLLVRIEDVDGPVSELSEK